MYLNEEQTRKSEYPHLPQVVRCRINSYFFLCGLIVLVITVGIFIKLLKFIRINTLIPISVLKLYDFMIKMRK